MDHAREPATDWPAAVISVDDPLRRLGPRIKSAEGDLRTARACYAALLEASRTYMGVNELSMATARLTAQELRVANLVAAGMSNMEIAEALLLSVHTVKTQIKLVLAKVSIRSRCQMGGA